MARWRKLGLVLLVNTAGGIIPAVLMYLLRQGTTVGHMLEWMGYGCVYSYSIGSLAFLVMGRWVPCCLRLPRFYRFPAILLSLAVLAVVGSLIANLVFLFLGWIPAAEFWQDFAWGLRTAIVVTVLLGAAVTTIEGLSYRLQAATLELRTRQLAEERARKAATEARLSSLESRIHPHFLFNTLNSISALIREDPERAERTVERLAALLRYSLDTNTRALVPLGQELRIVHDYLEIEKTRLGPRLRYTIDAPAEIEDLEVPPLALQTLVENSVKHAVAASRQGGEIRVTARLASGRLLLEVSDDGPGFDLRDLPAGHGLDSLQERMAALFDGAGRLETARREGRMVVSLGVPQKKVLV